MHTLAKHIETLLVKHNCVVVPGLGGFVTQVQPAHYDEQDGCFVPPKRSVTFNSILSNNDGLLVERYQQYERMTYYTATQHIAEQVTELKKRVQEDGQVELIGIGTLSANGTYGMKFTPKESGLMTPDLYALEPVFAEPANTRKEAIAPATPATALANEEESEKYYVLRLNKKIVNSLAAAVVCIMFYFLVIPTGNITDAGPHMASMFPTQVTHNTKVEKKVVIRKRKIINSRESLQAKEAESNAQGAQVVEKSDAPVEKAAPTVNEADKKEFVIVMASAVTEHFGNAFVDKLKAEGLPTPRLIKTDGMTRVVVGHFASTAEAYELMHKITENKDYAGSWVKEIPCE